METAKAPTIRVTELKEGDKVVSEAGSILTIKKITRPGFHGPNSILIDFFGQNLWASMKDDLEVGLAELEF